MGKRKASQTPKKILSGSDSETEHKKVRKKGKFKCKICSKIFTEKSNLRSHEYVHTSDTPFVCPYAPECGYRGKTKKYLSRHVKNNHRDMTNEHKCDVCGKFFHHASSLRVHAMVHTGEKPHSCNVCGKTFRVTYTLNTHMLTHTNEKPFQCSFCDYACRDSSTLRKHQNKHMGLQSIYECKICDKGYKNRSALKLHLAEIHLKENVRIYPCDRCGRSFKKKCQRRLHILSFHERALSCTCPVCGRTIASRLQLSTHLRSHMTERPFACTHEGCGLAFKIKSSLTKHRAIHDPSVHHACAYCGRKFVRKCHVRRHERVMHRERRRGVECHYCGARFYSKNYLLKHIQIKHIHKHRFKYVCDVCGLTTYNKPSIVMHLKYGHSNDHDMQCKLCDGKKVYKRHMYLKRHYWKTHNIKYKIARKPTNKPKNDNADSGVEIKVEPIEAESYEEIQLVDVKEEDEDYTESLEYSSRVLSEDIAASLLETKHKTKGRDVKETNFDDFFVRNVYSKQEEKPREVDINAGVDEEQNQIVKRKIKQILVRSKRREAARALKEKRIQEEKDRIQKDLEEAQMQAEKERQEIIELRRVREMYNEIMKAALTRERERKSKGKDIVKIKYFKKKPEATDKIENAEHPQENMSKDNYNNSNSIDTIVSDEETDNIEPNGDENAIDKTISLSNDNTASDIPNVNDTIMADDNDSNTVDEIRSRNKEVIVNLSKDAITSSESHKYDEMSPSTSYNNKNSDEKYKIAYNDNEEMKNKDDKCNSNEESHEMNEDEAMDIDAVLSDTFFDNHEDHNIIGSGSDMCSINENITNNNEISKRETQCTNSDLGNTLNNKKEVFNVIELKESHLNKETIDINEDELLVIHNSTNNTDNANENQEYTNNENTVSQASNVEDLQDINRNNDPLENTNNNEIQKCHTNSDETENVSNHENDMNDEYLDIPLSERIVKNKKRRSLRTKQTKEDKSWSEEENVVEGIGAEKTKKMEFKTYQCYVCFKLYQTKPELINHCQEHFDVCNERTLTKCPICNHISYKSIANHMKTKHKLTVKIPFNQIKDRNNDGGSKYCYDVNGTDYEVIPSVKILNKTASDNIDRKRRADKDKIIAKPKLVRKGNEWIVEREAVDIKYDEIPELTDRELHKCKVTDNDVDRLGQLSRLARRKGLAMMFPCFKCDKICLNFSALKLHKRRHEDNPKPFRARRNKRADKKAAVEPKKVKLDKSNRTAMPKPITNKHKCDAALRDFYENNIRGGDIEFWQFLKIFNRMDKEKVNDFEDLEARSDFGNHLDYYKDVADEDEMAEESEIAAEIDKMAGGNDEDIDEIAGETDEMDGESEISGESDEN